MTEQTSTSAGGARLEARLGLLDVYAICVGAMLAPGIFLLPGIAAADAGAAIVPAYLLAGLLVLPATLSTAELATAMPKAGGPYYFLDRALGPVVGTVGGLGMWAALLFKTAFAFVGLSAYLGLVIDVAVVPVALVLTAVFTVLNIVGLRKTSGLQILLVGVMVVALAGVLIGGLAAWTSAPAAAEPGPLLPGGLGGLIATTGVVFFSYAGLTQVASIAEEVRAPGRTIPLGLVLSVVTGLVVYVVGASVMLGLSGADGLADDLTPVASVTEVLLPGAAGVAVAVLAALAGFAATGNAGILSAARYPFAMARDGLLGAPLARVSPFGTPTVAVLATGGVMAAAILLLDIEAIASLSSAFILVVYGLLNLAVIIMRASGIPAYDPRFRSPWYPWPQFVGIVTSVGLVAQMGGTYLVFTGGMIVACLLWWRWWARHRVARHGAIFHWFARLGQRQDRNLDAELIGIVQEEGPRDEDRFDEIVARALVVDRFGHYRFEDALGAAAAELAAAEGIDADEVVERAAAGDLPVAGPVALAGVLLDDPGQAPRLVLLRARRGIGAPAASPAQPPAGAADEPLHGLFLLVAGRDAAGTMLRGLAQIAAHAEQPGFAEGWHAADSEQDLKETVLQHRVLSVEVGDQGPTSALAGTPLRELGLPSGSLVALVRRNGHTIVPDGEVTLTHGDRVTIVGEPPALDAVAQRYQPAEP